MHKPDRKAARTAGGCPLGTDAKITERSTPDAVHALDRMRFAGIRGSLIP